MLELGDMRVRLLASPGHSPGCMDALAEGGEDALVSDLVFAQGIGRTDSPAATPRHAASLERVFAEMPRETRIYPGHGPWGVTLGEAGPTRGVHVTAVNRDAALAAVHEVRTPSCTGASSTSGSSATSMSGTAGTSWRSDSPWPAARSRRRSSAG